MIDTIAFCEQTKPAGQVTYCGLNRKQLGNVLSVMSNMEEMRDEMTEEQHAAFDISLQCVTEIMNRMKDGKPIEFGVM